VAAPGPAGRRSKAHASRGKAAPTGLADGRFVADEEDLSATHARIVASKIERGLRASASTRRRNPWRLARGRQEVGRGEAAIRRDGGRSHLASLAPVSEKALRQL